MSDEVLGEDETQDRGEDLELGPEEAEEQTKTEGTFTPTASLMSDFCKAEEEYPEEIPGERYWVCQEEPGEGEGQFGEGWRGYKEGEGEGEEEQLQEFEMEHRSLDSEYLKAVLGTPLTFALLDIANKRPTDPIQYLGSYLLRWRWGNADKTSYEDRMKELNDEREAYREQIREKERQIMLEAAERNEELRRTQKEESSVEEEEDLGEGWVLHKKDE